MSISPPRFGRMVSDFNCGVMRHDNWSVDGYGGVSGNVPNSEP